MLKRVGAPEILLFAVCFVWACNLSAVFGAVSLKFVERPGDKYYVYNETTVELKWRYEVMGSLDKGKGIQWFAVINGVKKAIAFLTLPSTKTILPTRFQAKLSIKEPSTLVISNFTKEDLTSYTMSITHDLLANNPEDTTTVIAAVPPTIHPLSNQTAFEGQEVILSCNSSGTPPAKIEWRKSGSKRVLSNDSVWAISERILRHQRGFYKCTASNGYGISPSKNVYVDVYYFDLSCSVKFDNEATPILHLRLDSNPRGRCSVSCGESYDLEKHRDINYINASNRFTSGNCTIDGVYDKIFNVNCTPAEPVEFNRTYFVINSNGSKPTSVLFRKGSRIMIEKELVIKGNRIFNKSGEEYHYRDPFFTGECKINGVPNFGWPGFVFQTVMLAVMGFVVGD